METAMYWYDYQKDEYVERDTPPATDAEAKPLLPQNPAAQGLYDCYRQEGQSILVAMKNTLRACLGLPEEQSC